MLQKYLLFFVISFLCASAVNASTVSIDENELVENNKWSFDAPFKEDKKESEEMFSVATQGHSDHEYERKEENHHFNFDRDDQRHYHEICDKPTPVPVPASFWLLGSGLIGLIRFKKRKS
ncbi:MAG: PEP-CTERM sorting domain-containing protein [Candidatus Yonathbacteria bacterium]|nr:PEP-CTERM sorting domain-containing protein [Candidatus Yonathbacteria bacterium]